MPPTLSPPATEMTFGGPGQETALKVGFSALAASGAVYDAA